MRLREQIRRLRTQTRNDRLRFVEGVEYALARLPRAVELLKLDCEGAEYHLLADPRFLDHLAPREIRMEYHRGAAPVVDALERAGYAVELQATSGPVGLLAAKRKAPADRGRPRDISGGARAYFRRNITSASSTTLSGSPPHNRAALNESRARSF